MFAGRRGEAPARAHSLSALYDTGRGALLACRGGASFDFPFVGFPTFLCTLPSPLSLLLGDNNRNFFCPSSRRLPLSFSRADISVPLVIAREGILVLICIVFYRVLRGSRVNEVGKLKRAKESLQIFV